jgi:hypothetical protein
MHGEKILAAPLTESGVPEPGRIDPNFSIVATAREWGIAAVKTLSSAGVTAALQRIS